MQTHEQATGSAIGAALGFVNSILLSGELSWTAFLSTALLSAVGALVGFLVTSLLKWAKNRITK